MMFFSEKNFMLAAKITDDLFLVIDQVFRIFTDFPDLYFVKCRTFDVTLRTWPFPHKKNTFLNSFYTFAHIWLQHFSKYWGDECMGRPPPETLGAVPPVPLGFRPWIHVYLTKHSYRRWYYAWPSLRKKRLYIQRPADFMKPCSYLFIFLRYLTYPSAFRIYCLLLFVGICIVCSH